MMSIIEGFHCKAFQKKNVLTLKITNKGGTEGMASGVIAPPLISNECGKGLSNTNNFA